MDNKKIIDWELCLTQCNNNEELAKELFALFLQEMPDFKSRMAAAAKTKNTADLLETVHKLHGACCYIGVPRLKELVANSEIALKKGDFDWLSVPKMISEIEKIEGISQPEKYHC